MAAPQAFVSISRRPPDVEDYIDMFRRYRSWIIGPMFGGLVVSVVVAFLWPDTYVSTAVMRITPQQVSQRLVPGDVSTAISERLNAMEQEILSRGSLSELITRPSLDLYKKERTQRPLDDIVQDMRNHDIKISLVDVPNAPRSGTATAQFASAFAIQFSYTDRYKAQAVVRELVTKFTEQNVTVQRNQAHLTTQFLDDELKNSKDRLDNLGSMITKFERENQGKLPTQEGANMQALNSAQMEAQRLQDALSNAQQQKLMLEQQLQNYINDQNFFSQRAEEIFTTPAQATVKSQQLINADQALTQKKGDLAAMLQQYGESYPEIAGMKAQIALLEKRKADLEAEQAKLDLGTRTTGSTVRVPNPQVQQQLNQLKNNMAATRTLIAGQESTIERIQQQQAELSKKIAVYQGRIEAAPLNEQQYEQLTRDYALAKADYDDKVKKKEGAETQQNLEEHKAGANLEVLDPASLPEQATEPNRPVWAAIGSALGFMIGLVLAAGREMKDASLKTLKDVRAYTNLPVLTSVPLLENALLLRRKRRLFWLAWTSAFIVGTVAMTGSAYYHFFGKT